MSLPKAHHFVSQFLLREFADEAGWLHWTRVGEARPIIRRTRPAEIFVKRHLYSLVDDQGLKDPDLEQQLAALEAEASAVIAKMIAAARAGRPPVLSARERGVWYAFFLTQWRRTPETQRAVASDEEAMEMMTETLDEARARFPSRVDEIDALDTPAARSRILRNVRVKGLHYLSEEVMPVLEQRGIGILKIRVPEKRFVIGSRPVVKFTIAGQSDLTDPTVEMWLPVASDVAIGCGAGDGSVRLHFLDQARLVRQLNDGMARSCTMIAGASPALVRSLARANWPTQT